MHNVDKILFQTNINWDTDMVSVDVSCFVLKKDKIIGDNTIMTSERLYGVGICEKTGMINVCNFDGNYYTYFWVMPDEIISINPSVEEWYSDDVKRHIKAIREKWIIEKNTKKELKQKKNKQK